jgi:hypothetical protein
MARRTELKRWTAEVARAELAGWRRSGESLATYAATRGYQAQRLAWWDKRLSETECAAESAAVAFAPAIVVGGGAAAVRVAIEGASIRVEIDEPAAVAPAWVAELALRLRAGSPT